MRWRLSGVPVGLVEPPLGALLLLLVVASHAVAGTPWPAVALDVASCVIAALTGRWPREAGGALVAASGAYLLLPPGVATLGQLAILIPILGLGIRGERRLRTILAGAFLVLIVADAVRQSASQRLSLAGVIFLVAGLLTAWWVGDLFAAARRAQEEAARAALMADRLATARDLHDTVAHTLSLMSWRAQRAQLRGQADAEDLDFFVRASAQSVQELRVLLTLLRADEPAAVGDTTWRLPQLPEVIDQAEARLRQEGFPVTVTAEGDLASVPGGLAATLEKVSREAVNNIVKHGMPGTLCRLLVSVDDREVDLAFLNTVSHQPGAARPAGHPALGVAGMSERVAAVGGTLISRRTGNQWLTQVTLPLGVSGNDDSPATTPREGES
nr:hypothetical protein [Propionibacterium sp.]